MHEIREFDECVSDDVLLALRAKEEQEFSQAANEAGNLHPFQLSRLVEWPPWFETSVQLEEWSSRRVRISM